MLSLWSLWLPILAAAVLVFAASTILHVILPWHRGDAGKLPDEDAFLESLRAQNPARGSYMFPCPGSMQEMQTPEMRAKYEQGPVGFMTILPPGPMRIGRSLVHWFGFLVLVSIFAAYAAAAALPAGAPYGKVFQIGGTAAFTAYAIAPLQDSIWKGQRFATTLKFCADGVLYALVTGGALGAFWPGT